MKWCFENWPAIRRCLPVSSPAKILSAIFFLVIVAPIFTFAFELPFASSGNLRFHVDACQFQAAKGKTRLEIYYALNLEQFADQQNTAPVEFDVSIEILNPENEPLSRVAEQKKISRDRGNTFIDSKCFDLSPGDVYLKLSISSGSHRKKGVVEQKLHLRNFGNDFSISDLIFSSQVKKSLKPSPLVKHGLLFVPQPSRLFNSGPEKARFFVYYEINNLAIFRDRQNNYRVQYWIEDLAGNRLIDKEKVALPVSTSNTSRIEIIPLQGLKSGFYYLKLRVTDAGAEQSVSTAGYFRITNPDSGSQMLLPMTAGDVKKYYNQIKYIATNKEKQLFKMLDSRGKQQFLLNFWKSRDPDPATPENEFMQEHFRRMAFCEKKFKGGINSDMGRVYIKYGPPLDVKRSYSSTEESKPVTIWVYALNGRTEFVFTDRYGDGKYVLIHSTHPDEYSDPNWQTEIQR